MSHHDQEIVSESGVMFKTLQMSNHYFVNVDLFPIMVLLLQSCIMNVFKLGQKVYMLRQLRGLTTKSRELIAQLFRH